MHEIRFGQRLRRRVQKRPASQILLFVTPLTHTHHSTGYVMTAANYQAATTGAGQSLSQTERFNSERTACGPSVNPRAGSFLQDLMPLLTNYDSMEMSNNMVHRQRFGAIAEQTDNAATMTQQRNCRQLPTPRRLDWPRRSKKEYSPLSFKWHTMLP
jgi:hypothetical protein